MTLWSEAECRRITDQALAASRADEVRLSIRGGATSHLRFARNSPTTSGTSDDTRLRVTCTFGQRTGSASVNQFTKNHIRRCVERAEDLAGRAPEDPEHVPPPGPQEYARTDGFSAETAEDGFELMAAGVEECLDQARRAQLVAAGYTQATVGFDCTANSAGLFGYDTATSAYFSETVRTPDGRGSGWGTEVGTGVEDIDYGAASSIAVEKARDSAGARPLEPGRYPAVLEPACVANFLSLLFGAMGRRAADEGRSYFSAASSGAASGDANRIGEKLFADSVRIWSDPGDLAAPGAAWGEDGLAQRPQLWVDGGRLAALPTDRAWAVQRGIAPLPGPSNVLMAGGSGSLDDLVSGMDRGVLITSLWYIRSVDPRTLLYTGLTRDGVFWVEDGRISHPVTNFRWNDGPARILSHATALSRSVRVAPRASRAATWVVPAVAVSEFHLSSVSDAV